MPLTQVLGNLIETLPDLQSEILLRVWGSYSYDENHLDPADLSSKITYNVEWLLHTLAAGTTPGPPSGLDEALAVADEIGRSRAIQGVAVDAVIRSWRIAEQVLEESLIARSAEIERAGRRLRSHPSRSPHREESVEPASALDRR